MVEFLSYLWHEDIAGIGFPWNGPLPSPPGVFLSHWRSVCLGLPTSLSLSAQWQAGLHVFLQRAATWKRLSNYKMSPPRYSSVPAPNRADAPRISFLFPRTPLVHRLCTWKQSTDVLKDFLPSPAREALSTRLWTLPHSLPQWINVFKMGYVCESLAWFIICLIFRCAVTVYLHKINIKISFEPHIKFIFMLLQFYFCWAIVTFQT